MKHTVYEVTLKNGTKGLLINVPDATVMTYELNFRAGEYLVSRPKWETPHLMEHILLGANELYPKARLFQAEFEKNGAYCNASTGTYDITYEAECADFEWDRIFGLLLLAITKPLFLKEEFDAEVGNVREELTARSNNHFRTLSLALREAYGFYAMTDEERLKLMDHVQREDIKTHYTKTHTTTNARFVIAGNLSASRRQVIKKLLETMELPEGSGRRALPTEVPRSLAQPLYIENKTIDNIYFYMDTFMHRRMTDPETDALALINSMLTETLHSRILGKAREKGLVYSMSSYYGQTKDNSNWWFGAQIMPKNAQALFRIILGEVAAVRAGKLAQEDITAAKQYALGRYQQSAQTVSGTAAGYSGRYFFDEVIEDYYKVPERIRAISKQRIVAITNSLFTEKVHGFGVLGNCGEAFTQELSDTLQPLWQK